MKKIYLDYNATTPVDARVLEAMMPYLGGEFGNPSSIHSFGSRAKTALDDAREISAEFLGCRPREVVFTGSGSESNNFAVKGYALGLAEKGNHLITTEVEHASALETFRYLETQGFAVTYLGVGADGLVDLDELTSAITARTTLISVIFANNETGTIMPVAQIAQIAKERGVVFHTDAIQAVGKIGIDLRSLPVDLLSFSAHKLYAPKGVGGLFIRSGVTLPPLVHGGGQERGRRSGTENVAGIVGLGRAFEVMMRGDAGDGMLQDDGRVRRLRDALHVGIMERVGGVSLNGHREMRLVNTLNLSFEGAEGDSIVMNLDIEGIAASTGSACSEGNVEPSHVLLAMGQSKGQAASSVRFSLGRFTQDGDIRRALEVLPGIVDRIRGIGRGL
ncbi:MAG: cysteine desulfurase family protein [Deltaproteobacteria bacterium]